MNRSLAFALLAVLCSAAGAGCATGKPAGEKAPAGPVPDTSLGLSKTSVFEVPAPPLVKANDAAPGEIPPPPRPYALSPPRVPHGIADFLPITAKSNACVDCHAVAEKEKGQPTPLPASHYTDYRNAPEKRGDKVAGARWVCTACHVPLSNAKPLVVNRFTP